MSHLTLYLREDVGRIAKLLDVIFQLCLYHNKIIWVTRCTKCLKYCNRSKITPCEMCCTWLKHGPTMGRQVLILLNPRPENVVLTPRVVLIGTFFFSAEPQIESGRDGELLISCLYRLGNAGLNTSGCGSQRWEKLF